MLLSQLVIELGLPLVIVQLILNLSIHMPDSSRGVIFYFTKATKFGGFFPRVQISTQQVSLFLQLELHLLRVSPQT